MRILTCSARKQFGFAHAHCFCLEVRCIWPLQASVPQASASSTSDCDKLERVLRSAGLPHLKNKFASEKV